MDSSELLRYATRLLERLGLRYFVTGSSATIFYGEPRFTNDIDIVLDLPPGRVAELCTAFPADEFYVSEESARQAVARRGQFNIVHPASGLKLDLMIPAETPFHRSRFARTRRLRPAPDFDVAFASVEDVILKKWSITGRAALTSTCATSLGYSRSAVWRLTAAILRTGPPGSG
jgi:hypothetical protein